MAEYIEREALIAAYDKAHKGPPGGARKLMEEAPAVDVVPVKHGRWVKRRFGSTDVFCSECRTLETTRDSNYKSRHCPHCGAKMDLEVTNG